MYSYRILALLTIITFAAFALALPDPDPGLPSAASDQAFSFQRFGSANGNRCWGQQGWETTQGNCENDDGQW